jgi:glutaminyl-tRNA synthetase
LILCVHRYHFNTNLLVAPITKQLRWADGAAVRAELMSAVEALLGPKTEADLKPPEKKKKTKVRSNVHTVLTVEVGERGM